MTEDVMDKMIIRNKQMKRPIQPHLLLLLLPLQPLPLLLLLQFLGLLLV